MLREKRCGHFCVLVFVGGGVWDFDIWGTVTCPTGDDPSVYIKNGAFAQGWTSEDIYAQKGLYRHAENFTDDGFACSANPVTGNFSAWCGKIAAAPGRQAGLDIATEKRYIAIGCHCSATPRCPAKVEPPG
jgi:hypothetical protein